MARNKADQQKAESSTGADEIALLKMGMLDPASASSEDETSGQFVTALARGLELMRCFTPRDNVLGNQELARMTGLPKPTVTRLTNTLMRLGCLKREVHSGKYQLDVGVLGFGYAMLSNLSIRSVAHPLMEELANHAQAAVQWRPGIACRWFTWTSFRAKAIPRCGGRSAATCHWRKARRDAHAWRRCQRASESFSSTTCANAKQHSGR